MSKITKADRHKKSLLRQKISLEMAQWKEKINFLNNAVNHRVPGADESLTFALKEYNACVDRMREVDKGQMRQRTWARGRNEYVRLTGPSTAAGDRAARPKEN